MPSIEEIHFYIPSYAYKHVVDRLQDPHVQFHIHDIALLETESDRTPLVQQIASLTSTNSRISIVQDPIRF